MIKRGANQEFNITLTLKVVCFTRFTGQTVIFSTYCVS